MLMFDTCLVLRPPASQSEVTAHARSCNSLDARLKTRPAAGRTACWRNTTPALTEEQREQWAVDGDLQLEGALSPAEVDSFSHADRSRADAAGRLAGAG